MSTSPASIDNCTAFHSVVTRLETTPGLLSDNWCLQPAGCRLLYILATSLNAQHVCEVGTSIGYSTLWLAKAMQKTGGKLTTIDCSPERQQQAQQNLALAELGNTTAFKIGQAIDVLTELTQQADTKFDLAFIDAAKQEYIDYYQLLKPAMNTGGILVADNTQSHRESMQAFIDAVLADPDVVVADIDTPSGLIIVQF